MIETPRATAPENNVVVHAAAGTGKTWLLTSRVIRLLLEGSEPGAILAITFTRKAAGEIHERISERLLTLAGCDEEKLSRQLTDLGVTVDLNSRETARGLYEKYLSAIHALRATTFHAFCQDILRRFPLEADAPHDFELVESTADIEEAAWLALDRKISSEKESALAQAMDSLLVELGTSGARKALGEFLAHRSDWWAYTENEPDPVAFSAKRLRQLLQVSDAADPLAEFVRDTGIRKRIARYSELLAGHPTATNVESVEKLMRSLAEGTPVPQAFAWIGEAFLNSNGEPSQIKRSQVLVKKIGAVGADELIGLHQEISGKLLAAQTAYKRQWTFRVSRSWFLCGQSLLEEFQQLKAEGGLLDFSDLEWKTYLLLNRSRHAEWVQYKLDQRIDHLLIDEFQDTNPTQWRLLLPLLEEMAAGDPERRRSVFLVGDEKQSIYRFRRADPRLLHTARHWLEQHAQAETLTQHISWRSSPAIIRFVNLIFHRDDGLSDPAEDFLLNDFQAHDTHFQQLWGRAELLPIVRWKSRTKPASDQPWRNPLNQPRLTDEDSRHREEGDLITAKIRELLGKLIVDKGSARGLDGGDVMILLRDRTHARFYEEALRRAGIPYTGTGRGTFLRSLEVRDMMHLLKSLIEPYNDLALASALRSPVFATTEEDLLRLVQNPPGSWRERLARLPLDPKGPDPLTRAQRLLSHWSSYADRIPVHDLLDRIYNEGNIIDRYIAAAPAYLRSRVEANLNYFIELALEIDSGRYPSLSHFLAYLENQSDDDTTSPPDPSWNREPRVRVMTIHAAKGLEAPVVFLADAARDTGNRERGLRALIEWPVTDPRPRYFHLAGKKDRCDDISQALLHEQQWSSRREEANLLYVALTRARQVLYVSGCESGLGGRGWYGFIERRLLRAVHTGEANRAGLEVHTISKDDGEAVFNTCGRLEYGSPDVLALEPQPTTVAGFTLDPALTKPLSPVAETGIFNPSCAVHTDDDNPDDADTMTEMRTGRQRRGVVIHRMLGHLTQGDARPVVMKQLRQEFNVWPVAEDFDAWWHEACGVVDNTAFREFFDPVFYQQARNEVPILYRDGERDVYGIIDRLVIREKEIVLIDYKTRTDAVPENIGQLAQDFYEQMRSYGTGANRLWPGKKLRLLLIFTACGGFVELPAP